MRRAAKTVTLGLSGIVELRTLLSAVKQKDALK